MEQKLKEADWKREYPEELENENLFLKRKRLGRKLVYEVYTKPEKQFLGTCHVMEKIDYEVEGECTSAERNKKFVVKGLLSIKNMLEERRLDIQVLIRERF